MGRYISGFLSLVLACSLAVMLASTAGAAGSRSTAADMTSPAASQGLDAHQALGKSLMHSIDALGRYVVRNADGTLRLSAPAAVLAAIPAADLASLNASVSVLNSGVRAGRLTTYPGGLVQPTGANSLVLLDGRTGTFYNWWGTSHCISHHDLADYRNGFVQGAVIAVLAFAIDVGLGVAYAVVYAFFVMFDRGNGACINATWGGAPIWMSSQ
jgi:hypothetical protein